MRISDYGSQTSQDDQFENGNECFNTLILPQFPEETRKKNMKALLLVLDIEDI